MSTVKTYWVYMVRCVDQSYYVGITSEIDRRIAEHNLGISRTAYTFARRPVALVYAQAFSNVDDAIAAEKRIKGWSRAKKSALICGDWEAIARLARTSRGKEDCRGPILRQAQDDRVAGHDDRVAAQDDMVAGPSVDRLRMTWVAAQDDMRGGVP